MPGRTGSMIEGAADLHAGPEHGHALPRRPPIWMIGAIVERSVVPVSVWSGRSCLKPVGRS